MNELTDSTNTVNNPQQAVQEFVGEQFIEWILDYISSQMQTWPVLAKIRQIQTRPEKIKKFMLQRFLASQALLGAKEGDPGFLRFAISNLSESDDPEAESALEILEQKMNQELTSNKRQQWLHLLHTLGSADEEIAHTEPKDVARTYIAELSDIFSASDWQTSIGAFAAFERVLPEEYKVLVAMLKNNLDISVKDIEVLDTAVSSTNHILDKVVFDHQAKQLVWEGVRRQMEIHQEFLSGLIKYLET